MSRSSPLLWLALVTLILLPSGGGKILLDLLGGLMLTILILPILIGGIGWIGWKILQSKMYQCESCGANLLNKSQNCPICGETFIKKDKINEDINNSRPASSATIDISAKNVE